MTRTIPFSELPELMTVPEVQAYLSLSRGTVYAMLRRGEITHSQFGRRIRIPKAQLMQKAAGAEL
jgi:excisionase family DNA binding protein